MAKTGMQRSLTVSINKTIAGMQVDGYPHTYDGKLAFSFGNTNYPVINDLQLATMPTVDYQNRLMVFKNYVQSLEQGLNFSTDTDTNAEAYRVNLTSCPIG